LALSCASRRLLCFSDAPPAGAVCFA